MLRLQVRRQITCELCKDGVAGDYSLSPRDSIVKQRGGLPAKGKAMVMEGASEGNGSRMRSVRLLTMPAVKAATGGN